MRTVELSLSAAVLLGLCSSSAAFLAPANTRFQVPANRLAARSVRLLSAVAPPPDAEAAAAPDKVTRPPKDVSALLDADKTVFRAGTVSSVHDYGVFITVDGQDGLLHISKVQSARLTPEALRARFEVGAEVSVRILNVDADANKLSLTMLPPAAEPDYSAISALSPDDWVEGTVVSNVAYGAFVRLPGDVDGLVHISQLADARVEDVAAVAPVGATVRVRVIEVAPEARRVRLSMRDASSAAAAPTGGRRGGGGGGERAAKDVSRFVGVSPEEWQAGTVVSFTPFGAFVRLEGGVDGLLHVSEMAAGRVGAPTDVLSEGQEVKVRVIGCDADAGRVSLSLCEPRPQRASGPRDVSALAGVSSEEFLPGTVTSLQSYGAFVALDGYGGVEGLLHVSRILEERVEEASDVLSVGGAVSVRVVDVDTEAGKVTLSALPVGSPKDRRPGGRRSDDDGDSADDDSSDPFGASQRRKSPRPRFNDYDDSTLSGAGAPAGEPDWKKYLNQYFDKKDGSGSA